MSVLEVLVYGSLGIAVLLVVVYIAARVGSIGWYRTREEYDRSFFKRHFSHNGSADKDGEG